MGGPGSGRRPNGANGTNGHVPGPPPELGRRVTFGDLLGKMQAAAPPASPPAINADANPPAPVVPLSPAPPERASNRSFASMAGYVATNIGVSVIGDHLRKKKLEPREVAHEDLQRTSDATAEAIVRAIGDAEVPWWAGLVAAWGNLYLAMRVGAKPKEPEEASGAEPTTTTAPPAASPLGHGGGVRAPADGRRPIRVFE